MKLLYLDCASGISGDMTLGALVDLGASMDAIQAGLASMEVAGWKATARKAMKGPLAGTAFRVEVDESLSGGDRSLPDIEALIHKAKLSERARTLALRAFRMLGEAEAAIHGTTLDQVHFHEVGAADSIVDIVGSAIALDLLGIDEVIVSPIPMSRGHVKCRHGLIPLPAPAALLLARDMPICKPPAPTLRELSTPTGLALAKAFASAFGEMPEGIVRAVGCGLGGHNLPWPNVLRAVLLESTIDVQTDRVMLLEANLDDMTGEALAFAQEQVLEAGALDVWLAPIQMKKGRPGFIFSVLCEPREANRLSGLILRETTTLGVRRRVLERTILSRETITVETRFGSIRCKISRLEDGSVRVKPEFEDCRTIALASGTSLAVVSAESLAMALAQLQ